LEQKRLVYCLQDELTTANEDKKQTEQRYSDKLIELETTKREFCEVKKSCAVIHHEWSQQQRIVDDLRDELNTVREEKNEMEQRYNNKQNEIEDIKKEYDEVKKSHEVILSLIIDVNSTWS